MNTMKIKRRTACRAAALLPLMACVSLTGCGARSQGAVEVAAKVNGDAITVHQLDFAAQRRRDASVEQAWPVQRHALEELIDQQIAVQGAQRLRLDRDPAVLQRIDEARREVLASAFVESLADAAPRPSEADVRRYYADHPGLFESRKIYGLQRLQMPVSPATAAEIEARADSAKSLDELLSWLREKGIGFTADSMTQPAEALPLPVVDRMATLAEGRSVAVPRPNGVQVLTIVSAQPAPRALADAHADIEQFLLASAKRSAVQDVTRRLRADARVEYLGAYASAPSALIGKIE